MEDYRALADEMRRAGALHDADRNRPITSWDARAWAGRVEGLQASHQGAVEAERQRIVDALRETQDPYICGSNTAAEWIERHLGGQ